MVVIRQDILGAVGSRLSVRIVMKVSEDVIKKFCENYDEISGLKFLSERKWKIFS